MWYTILYYLIFLQHFVITLPFSYRPVLGMTNYQPGSLDAVYSTIQPVQSNLYPNNGNLQMLRQSNNLHQPIQPVITMSYQTRKQPQFMVEQLPLRYSVQKPPILPPVLSPVNIPYRSPSKTSILMEIPFHGPNQMTVEQMDYRYLQPVTWPTMTTTTRPTTTEAVSTKRPVKRIRKSKLRDDAPKTKSTLRVLKMSSSTRPPYPGGIRPETEEVEGDYVLCDGNAICHKYVWTTKKEKTTKKEGARRRVFDKFSH